MRRLLTVIQSLFLLDIIVFAMVFPFAWTLRDGLGPNAVTSHGFFAVKRALMAFLGGCENWQRSVESRKETVRDGLAALREMVFETMQDRIGKLAENRAFYCRKGHWPWMGHMLDKKELCLSRFDVVKTDEQRQRGVSPFNPEQI